MAQDIAASFIRPDEFWRSLGLQAGQKVVHLGCGAGFYLVAAAQIVGQTGSVIGVDILSHLLEAAESRAARANVGGIVRTIRADIEQPNGSTLPDNSADWVLVANILHLADPAQILVEACRLVVKTGKVAVVEWLTVATPVGPPADHRISQAKVLELAHESGLAFQSNFTPSPYHYGLLLGKHV